MTDDSIFKPDENGIPTIVCASSNESVNMDVEYEHNSECNSECDYNGECECECECDYNGECDGDYNEEKPVSFIGYDLEDENNLEKIQNEYHIMKDCGDWYYAKMIVSHAYQDKNNTDLFIGHLEKQFLKNGDSFDNIITAYYKNDLNIDIMYQFSCAPAKHLIDNLRIPAYKPHGIIFSNPENANKWSFKIVVITKQNVYTANRYITEDLIGCY